MSPAHIFWDVDTQVDFICPEGKLYVLGAEAIVPNLKRLSDWARLRNILVVASADAHQEGDEEFSQYPPHCLVGTPGQEKIPETRLGRQVVIPNRPTDVPARPQDFEQIVVEKQKFDVFTNPNTEKLLARLGRLEEIVLYGVVTEICVERAALGLLNRGFRVCLVRDAVHHLEAAKAEATFAEVERRGGRLVSTDEVVSKTGG